MLTISLTWASKSKWLVKMNDKIFCPSFYNIAFKVCFSFPLKIIVIMEG